MNIALLVITIAIVAVSSCDDPQPEPPRSNLVVADSLDSQTTLLVGRNLADNLLAYMNRLEEVDSISTATLRRRLPLHERMLTELLAQYNREMLILDVGGKRPWQATMDSVKVDLEVLRRVSDSELRPWLRAHQRRVAKLIEHHEAMLRAGRDLERAPRGRTPDKRHGRID